MEATLMDLTNESQFTPTFAYIANTNTTKYSHLTTLRIVALCGPLRSCLREDVCMSLIGLLYSAPSCLFSLALPSPWTFQLETQVHRAPHVCEQCAPTGETLTTSCKLQSYCNTRYYSRRSNSNKLSRSTSSTCFKNSAPKMSSSLSRKALASCAWLTTYYTVMTPPEIT